MPTPTQLTLCLSLALVSTTAHAKGQGKQKAKEILGDPKKVATDPWSAKFGSLPDSAYLQAESGFSSAIHFGYHVPVSSTVSVGPGMILDYSLFNLPSRSPQASVGPGGPNVNTGLDGPSSVSLLATAPFRIHIHETRRLSMGLRLEPGLGFTDPDGPANIAFAVALHSSFTAGYRVTDKITVGGGVSLPFTILVGDVDAAIAPFLFGPVAEFHLLPKLALTTELAAGPWIAGGDVPTTTEVGFKAVVGVAYRLRWY